MNKPYTDGLTTFWPDYKVPNMNEHFNLGIGSNYLKVEERNEANDIAYANLKPEQRGPIFKIVPNGVEAVKFDQGKLDWSLMPFEALEEVTKVLEYGKTKYSAHNWSSGEGFKYSRVFSALMRHILAFMRGEDNDPETGLSHIAHAACNILFLLHFIKFKEKYSTCDDRK